jgi:hypothetical protein
MGVGILATEEVFNPIPFIPYKPYITLTKYCLLMPF